MSDRARADNFQISKAIALWNCLDNLPGPDASVSSSHHPRYFFPLWFSHGVPKSKKT